MNNLTWKQWYEQQTNYDYTGNTLQPTTWAVCWVCGKKIAINHTEECRTGVHNTCHTIYKADYYNTGKVELMFNANPNHSLTVN